MARPKMRLRQGTAAGMARAVEPQDGVAEREHVADEEFLKTMAEERAARAAAEAEERTRAARAAAEAEERTRAEPEAEERERSARYLEQLEKDEREVASFIELAARTAAVVPTVLTGRVASLQHHEDSLRDDHGHSRVDQPRELGRTDVLQQQRRKATPSSSADKLGESSRKTVVPQQRCKETEPVAPPAQFLCTACTGSVPVINVTQHPNVKLPVGICLKCLEFLRSGPYTKEMTADGACASPHDNECSWCGDGGEVLLCDTCDKTFCKECILRNFGIAGLTAIEEPTTYWSCFFCDPTPLTSLTRKLQSIEGHINKRPYNIAMEEETVAAAIARQQEGMQQQNPGVKKSRCNNHNQTL